EV
ncbi:hypothetical protein D030_4158B, partial [Vibrio parahaemolyticus AQ3810]